MLALRMSNGEFNPTLLRVDVRDRILTTPIDHSVVGGLSFAKVALTAYGLEALHFRFRNHKSLQKAIRALLLPDLCSLLSLDILFFGRWEGKANAQVGGTPSPQHVLKIFARRGFMDVCETLSRSAFASSAIGARPRKRARERVPAPLCACARARV